MKRLLKENSKLLRAKAGRILARYSIQRHWEYLKYVLRHKWFVFQEGRKLGVPLLTLILHDWDKFLPDEWFPYAQTFYAPDGTKQYVESHAFTVAWLKHQNRNKHHWQYWMITWDRGETECLPMPVLFQREMLADWRGAGRAITGKDNTFDWYLDNYYKVKLHRDTRLWLDNQMTGGSGDLTMEEYAQTNNCDVELFRNYHQQGHRENRAEVEALTD